jgi:hypothetical protein
MRLFSLLLLAALVFACDGMRGVSGDKTCQREPIFRGMCDASGAVALDAQRFAVADDEDNVLRVYDAACPGDPVSAVDLSAALGLLGKKHPREADIEAATRIGERALWLSSHGRSSQGKARPERFRFFATNAPRHGEPLRLVGEPYAGLLADMLGAPSLARFELARAAELPPKSPGGLNIEGLAAAQSGGEVWIGFRNPVPEGRALLVNLQNPLDVLLARAKPRFGAPATLDLDGLGVRAIALRGGRYLIAAGPPAAGGGKRSQLYSWDGTGAPSPLPADLSDFNPEAIVGFEQREQLLLLSDDGELSIGGERCKDRVDPARREFRGRWLTLP